MSDPNEFDRNPLLLPDVSTERRLTCPACGSPEYRGRRVQGVHYRICLACNHAVQGGLPREPADPRKPAPPMNPADRPLVDYVQNRPGQFEELRRRPDQRPDFRRGAPVPNPGEEQ